jgi:hypothetical protein
LGATISGRAVTTVAFGEEKEVGDYNVECIVSGGTDAPESRAIAPTTWWYSTPDFRHAEFDGVGVGISSD